MFCNNCGTKLKKDQNYCSNCGKKTLYLEQQEKTESNDVKNSIKNNKTYGQIKKLFDHIINDYITKTKKANYQIYTIEEYEKVIVFDCGHITYFGIEPESFPIYYENDNLYKLCSDYNIIFQNLILNNEFIFDEYAFMKNYPHWSKLFDYHEIEPSYVFSENDINKRPDREKQQYYRIFDYVTKKLPELNLYTRYIEHQQNNLDISSSYSYKKLLKNYDEMLNDFISDYLIDYNYKIFEINEHEKVFSIEDDCVIYFGLKGISDELYDGSPKNKDSEFISLSYHYVFQELTYNGFFKFNRTKFAKEHKGYIIYIIFYYEMISKDYLPGTNYNYPRLLNINNYSIVKEKFPNLKLKEINENWPGILYNFIIYEFSYKGENGFAIAKTLNSLPNKMGRTIFKKWEDDYGYMMYNASIKTDTSWGKAQKKLIEDMKNSNWENVKKTSTSRSIFAEKVQYFSIPRYIKKESEITKIKDQLLEDAKNNKFPDIERITYDLTKYKWKSEELMYECVKKVFKGKKVIHQYRPYYLRQMSYDVFVCGKNLAFEYQGKQHFEPIEIFGGEENFLKQQKRDELKKELSKKNNIKLIYINYWEDITVELIKEKVKEIEKV